MNEIFSRRSCRGYTDRPVEDEKLELLLRAANYAPSAMNNQERVICALSSASLLERLNIAVKASVSPETAARIEGRMGGVFNFFYRAPMLIILSQKAALVAPAADCACSLQNIFLEAEHLGLGSCWINQLNSLCDSTEVRAILTELGIPADHKVYGCAAVGYASTPATLIKSKESKIIICK